MARNMDHQHFDSLVEFAKRGRWPLKGRKIANATYVRIDSIAEPTLAYVKHHYTDILIYHKDGRIEVSTYHLCSSVTTKMRLWGYAHVSVQLRAIPAINGYATSEPKTWVLHWKGKHVLFNGKDGYITLLPSGEIDQSTVKPIEIEVVTDTVKLARVMRKLGKHIKVIRVHHKLSDGDTDAYKRSEGPNPENWLLERYNMKLEEMSLSPLPKIPAFCRADILHVMKRAMNNVRWDIARREGCLGKLTLLRV